MKGDQTELKVTKHVIYVHHFGFVSYPLTIYSSTCNSVRIICGNLAVVQEFPVELLLVSCLPYTG